MGALADKIWKSMPTHQARYHIRTGSFLHTTPLVGVETTTDGRVARRTATPIRPRTETPPGGGGRAIAPPRPAGAAVGQEGDAGVPAQPPGVRPTKDGGLRGVVDEVVVTGQVTLGPLAKGVGAEGGPRAIVGARAATTGHGRVGARKPRVAAVAGDDAVIAAALPVKGGRAAAAVGAAGQPGGQPQAVAAPSPAAGAGRPAEAPRRAPTRPPNGLGTPRGARVVPP